MFRVALMATALLSIVACTHPVGVQGGGDLVSATGDRDCSMEQGQCDFVVINEYDESYTAAPRPGFQFSHWEGCGDENGPVCSWNIPAETVKQYWGSTASVPMIAVFTPESVASITADVAFIAGQARPKGSEHHLAVQNMCASRLTELGFSVDRQTSDRLGITNVVGVAQGRSDETVVVSAHYDSVIGCAGADDNASGVAGLLETARVLAQERHQRTLVVACWDGEETGYEGSRSYARAQAEAGVPIEAVFVYEMIGYRDSAPYTQYVAPGFAQMYPDQQALLDTTLSRGDFVTWVYDSSAEKFVAELGDNAKAAGLQVVEVPVTDTGSSLIQDLRRSDHASFWDVGIPAVMVTDTGPFRNPNYHCQSGPDTPETLDYEFADAIVTLTTKVIRDALNP